jgi:predicted RecA/RadA family phage recombinase
MKNYRQDGDVITVPAPSGGTISGKLVVIGSLVGIAQITAAEGESVPLVTKGVNEYPKTSALAIAIGDKVYWDSTANVLNKTASGNTLVGIAVEAAANPSPFVNFKLGPVLF